jgi:hypothetical protein
LSDFRLRVVSDLHVRSHWGLWPPDFSTDEEDFPQNKFNKFLWESWMKMCRDHPPADLLAINGDLDDGEDPLGKGMGVKTANEDVAKDALIEVLRPALARADEWILVKGSKYHEQWFGPVIKELKPRPWSSRKRVEDVGNLFLDDLGKFPINIAHHPEGGPVLYKGTTLDKTILWSIIQAHLNKTVDAKLIIRSHWHFYGSMQINGRSIIQTPSWQLITPHMKKHAYFRYQPDIGFVDILFKKGEPYPLIQPVLFPYPLALIPAIHIRKEGDRVKA